MPEYIFQGSLAENPLPEVLQKIHYYKVPGVLTAIREDRAKHVFISGGEVIFASSEDPGDRLGEFLLARKQITPAQYQESVTLLKSTSKRQGTILVEMGVLTPRELYKAVREQVTQIVWSLFDWSEGQITFRVGKFKDDEIIKLNLDTRLVIIEGVKKIADPKRVVRWLGGKEDIFVPSENALALLPTLPLTADDKKVFRLVDGERSFLSLLQVSPYGSTETAKILYVLYVLGLIGKREEGIRMKAPAKP
ncbi:MAG: DUF4388 domain-containing protein [Acidobacteriota bacterium]|jgi:hypothetical protein